MCTWSVTSVVSDSVTPMDCSLQSPLSMRFSRQAYWSGLPCPSPGDLPDPEIEPMSSVSPTLQPDSLPTEPLGSSYSVYLMRSQAGRGGLGIRVRKHFFNLFPPTFENLQVYSHLERLLQQTAFKCFGMRKAAVSFWCCPSTL